MIKFLNMAEPSEEQIEMTKMVEQAICATINRLAGDGIPVACLAPGLGLAFADLVTCQKGPKAVVPSLHELAELIEFLQADLN